MENFILILCDLFLIPLVYLCNYTCEYLNIHSCNPAQDKWVQTDGGLKIVPVTLFALDHGFTFSTNCPPLPLFTACHQCVGML